MSRDDIVFVPRLQDVEQPTAPVRAREERRVAGATRGHRSIVGTYVRIRAARAVARKAAVRAGARRAVAGRTGLRAPVGAIGLSVTALLVAGLTALRLGTGQPLEKVGQDLNDIFLGDADDEARIRTRTRNRLTQDADITRLVGRQGKVNSQVASIARDLETLERRQELGRVELERTFPVNNTLDQLILRADRAFRAAWKGGGGEEAAERFRNRYGEALDFYNEKKGSPR